MNKEMKNIKLAVITGIAAEFILCMAFFLFGKVPFGGWSSGSNVLGAFTVAFHSPGGFLFKILNITSSFGYGLGILFVVFTGVAQFFICAWIVIKIYKSLNTDIVNIIIKILKCILYIVVATYSLSLILSIISWITALPYADIGTNNVLIDSINTAITIPSVLIVGVGIGVIIFIRSQRNIKKDK